MVRVTRHRVPPRRSAFRIHGPLLSIVLLGCASTPAPSPDRVPAPVTVPEGAPSDPASPGGPASPTTASPPGPALEDGAGEPARDALAELRLLVPVAGVAVDRIGDSFSAPRGSRTHGALDIMAPRGTPVLSADAGVVLRASENRSGGRTIYVADSVRRVVYYYAHLDRYAEGIATGRRVARGDTIGFVGTTGNAPANVPHLHFQMMRMHPAGRYWQGEPVNPLPFLHSDTGRVREPDE